MYNGCEVRSKASKSREFISKDSMLWEKGVEGRFRAKINLKATRSIEMERPRRVNAFVG
jgi:hypothetical protein